MQLKGRKSGIIKTLATTSMFTAISSAAYATPPHICNNPVTGFSNLACWVGDENFTVAHNGTITPAQTATAIAVHTDYSAGSTLVNNGTISMGALGDVSLNGIEFRDDLNGTLVNNGSILIYQEHADGNTAYGVKAGTVTGSIINNHIIDITDADPAVDAYAYGVYTGDLSGTINNTGTIKATATAHNNFASARGILVNGLLSGSVINSGTITASAHGGTASAWGIYTGSDLTGSITNTGTITATADSGKTSDGAAYGIRVNGDAAVGSTITNNGTITATINDHGYIVYGIFAGDLDGTMVNNGTVHAVTNGVDREFAYGIDAGDMYATSSFTNNGTVTAAVNGTVTNGGAYGIAVGGNLDSAFTNTGIVTATYDANPGNAYSIYVAGGIGSIDNSGILTGGIHTGGTIDVTNSGIIALTADSQGANVGQLNRNYTQTGNGKLIFGVAGDATYGTLDVGGNGDFIGSSKLGVMLSADNTYTGTTLSNVITMGGAFIHPNPFTVTDNSLAYNFTATTGGSSVSLVATPTGLTTLANAVNATGHSADAGAASALDALLTGGSPEMIDELSGIFGGVTTNQQAAAQVAQFVPTLASDVQQVLMDLGHTTTRIVQSRLDDQSGVSSGENISLTDRHFWLKPFGTWTNQDDHNGALGYDASSGGAVFGGDGLIKNDMRLGAAFAYAHSTIDSSGFTSQNDRVDSYQGILYGNYDLNKATSVNLQLDASDNTNQGKRSVAGATAFSNYDSWAEHAGIGIERKLTVDNATSFIPSLRADYTNINSGGYAETGAGAFNLNVNGSSAQELILGIDGKFNHQLIRNLSLSGDLGVGYDTLGGRTAIASSFAGGGAAFVTPGIKPSPWIGNGGLGLTLNQWQGVELTTRYDIEAREDFTQQTASLKLRMPF